MPRHWLADVAEKAGWPHSDKLATSYSRSIHDAWNEIRRVCGATDEELTASIASQYRVDVADFALTSPQAAKLVPESLARRFTAVPLREDDRTLVLASPDPVNIGAEQEIAFASGRRPVFQVASPTAVLNRLNKLYASELGVEALLSAVDGVADEIRVLEEVAPETLTAAEIDAAPIVKLTNLILRDAVLERASDVHVEPSVGGSAVRFRVDGVLRRHLHLPLGALNRVVSRIKILGKLDIADRMRPQDGRARVELQGKIYDIRISTVPTRDTEKVVMRILEPDRSVRLSEIGVPAGELERIRKMLGFRDGIVIITGPTGSGKTTTMYSCIRELTTGEINITTVEDPVEYEMPGITQIQVDVRRGVTFPSALRAILRQDPDVVFVGEIRDLETAEVSVQASVTGHLVLATLHTNDAVGVVQRLVDLGLSRAAIASAVRGVVGQRLLRLACANCAQEIEGSLTDAEERLAARYGVRPTLRAIGCDRCRNTGYRGRVPVCEVLLADSALVDLIVRGASAAEVQAAAEAGGMRRMREAALDHVRANKTTLEEVERVLGESMLAPAASTTADTPRVLVVDDDAVVRTVARAALEKAGFQVSEAGDGAAAMEIVAQEQDLALMIMDLKMPGMGGMQVLARLRGSVRTAGLPVIVLTGSEDAATEVAAMEAGADDYIRKPIDPGRFLARIKATLRRAGG